MPRVARRSIVALVDIPAGAALQPGMLACRRPATGIAPGEWDRVVGRTARTAIASPPLAPCSSGTTWADTMAGRRILYLERNPRGLRPDGHDAAAHRRHAGP